MFEFGAEEVKPLARPEVGFVFAGGLAVQGERVAEGARGVPQVEPGDGVVRLVGVLGVGTVEKGAQAVVETLAAPLLEVGAGELQALEWARGEAERRDAGIWHGGVVQHFAEEELVAPGPEP